MTLINLRLSQLEPSNDSEIALRSQVNSVSANVDSFESYANSTFTSGGYSNAVVLSENIKILANTPQTFYTSFSVDRTIEDPDYDNGLNKDEFGTTVGISSNNRIIVGSKYENNTGGAAYLFNATTGSLIATKINSGANENFGTRVAIANNYAIIGTWFDTISGTFGAGSATIIRAHDGATVRTINNPNPSTVSGGVDLFSTDVAISDNYIAIAANGEDTGGEDSGVVYIYNADGSSYLRTITNPNTYGTTVDDAFAFSIDLDDNILIAGVQGEDSAGFSQTGAAYVFDVSDGSLLHTFTNPAPGDGDVFGRRVAVKGNYAVVGCPRDDTEAAGSGRAYIYELTNGTLVHTLTNPNDYGAASGDDFGEDVGINDNLVLIGAANEDSASNINTGRVYAFDIETGDLLHTFDNPLTSLQESDNDNFGDSISVAGNVAVVGNTDTYPEKVFVLNLGDKITSTDPVADSNTFILGSEVNSRDNLLVYLDGILQHPDQYVVSGNSLTLSNTDPLPIDISVGIRHLQSSNTILSNTSVSNSTIGANGTIAWDYENKQLYVYDGHTIGGYLSNVATRAVPEVWTFQGSTSGYTSGGSGWPGSPSLRNTVQKYSFTVDTNATDVADLLGAKSGIAGHSSSTHGYTSGGPSITRIEKFDFATEGTSIDVGDLTLGRTLHTGLSSETYGWVAGGNPTLDTIESFPFSSDTDSSDVGELPVNSWDSAGTMSENYGYISARRYGPGFNDIHKFNFVGSLTVTDIADLSKTRYGAAGVSSDAYGYNAAGSSSPTTGDPTAYTTIDKFPFASDADATSVGSITIPRTKAVGSSSQVNGYVVAGNYFNGVGLSGNLNSIEKFPFASDTNAVDSADLLANILGMASQQY